MKEESVNLMTILISLGSSIIVSLFTFILGLKAGKNQNDRQILKNHYRDLYVHFKKLFEGIEFNNPLNWSNFKYERIDDKRSFVATPLITKERSGDSVELDSTLIQELIKEERQSLKYGYEFSQTMITIENIIISCFEKQIDLNRYKEENTKEWSIFLNRRPPNGIPYHPILLESVLFLRQENKQMLLDKIKDTSELEWSYLSIRIPIRDKKKEISIEFPLLNNINELINHIYDIVLKEDKVIKLLKEKNERMKNLIKLKKKIVKRVKEPHTFFNTLGNSFLDIIRN